MKMKKWLALLLAVLMLLCTTACDSSSSDRDRDRSKSKKPADLSLYEESADGPLLYRVTDEDGDIVWLFGSIHVGEEDFYPLPDYITDALEGSDGLAVEFDIIDFESDYLAQTRALQKLMYTDGSSIKDHLSDEVYEQAVEALQDLGIYMAVYDMYMPVLWSSLIDSSLLDEDATSLGVDRYVIEMAYDLDLPVIDVESAALQYGMMASYSEDLQEMLLKSSIEGYENTDEYVDQIQDLIDMWADGNAMELREYLSSEGEGLTQKEKKLYQEYNKKMCADRDEDMTAFVMDALDDGEELFVCVGAAHVVGVDGIIDRLIVEGYTVELVD